MESGDTNMRKISKHKLDKNGVCHTKHKNGATDGFTGFRNTTLIVKTIIK